MISKKRISRAPLGLRVLVGVLAPALVGLGLAYVYACGSPAPCGFYRLTGLYCPGCGSGRALEAALHLRLGQSLGYNLLLLPLGVPAVAALAHEYVRFVFPGAGLRPLRVSNPAAFAVGGTVIAFWILRNLPWFSFLAP